MSTELQKKIKRLGLLIIYLVCNIVLAQNSQRSYTPYEMREDIDTLVKYLEETHPDIYYRYPKIDFYKDVDILKKSFNKNFSRIEFYLASEPLLAKLDDGHTEFHIIDEYNDQNPLILPYFFKLSPTKPFIICNGSYPAIKAQLPENAEIISINNIPSQRIVRDIINLNTGENETFKAEFGGNHFYFYLEALYHSYGKYSIKYKNKGKLKTVLIKGIRKNEIDNKINEVSESTVNNRLLADSNYSLTVLDKDKTAIIDFKSFDWEGYKVFVDSAFTVIKNKGIQNLIINLMDNGGGDSDIGDDFFQYILDKPFRQYEKIVIKNSRFIKERLKAHKVGKILEADDLKQLSKPNGTIDTLFYDDIALINNPLRFEGKVYLLVNSQTYSSAADFAQCFNFYKRGLIIGEETGGFIKSYGDIVTTHLPHTELNLTISSTLYYNIGAKENDWKGVVPDIKIPPQKALGKALELIRNQ